MTDPSNTDRLQRLQRALDVYLEFQESGGECEDLLARHPDLAELLRPMLEDAARENDGHGDGDVVALAQGRVFGDYKILREVGRGGMGVVFEAEQISLGRRVALKLLHGHLALSPRAIARFRAEAGAAARLQHPGIVPVHEVGERDGHHFFSMEFVDGQALNTLVHGGEGLIHPGLDGKSRVAQAAVLVAQVADALQCAHDNDLIHRDVKPHNVMITDMGEVKLLDFGLAKHLDQRQASASGLLGTPYYMSPEQASGEKGIGPRSDLFSLGVVLYELLTGARPFEGDTPQAVVRAIEVRDPVPLCRAAPRTPRDLQTICHKAMEKQPDDRYPSAGAMAADLLRFSRLEPILAAPPSVWDRGAKWLRRHRGMTVAAGLFVFALATTTTLYAVDQWKADAKIREQSERVESSSELAHRGILQLIQTLSRTVGLDPESILEDRARIEPAMRLCVDYLVQVGGDDVERQQQVGMALSDIATLQHRLRDLPSAIEAVGCAIEAMRRVVRTDPDERESLAEMLLAQLRYLQEYRGAGAAEFVALDELCRQMVQEDATDDRLELWMRVLLERGSFHAAVDQPGAGELLRRCQSVAERLSPTRVSTEGVRARRAMLRASQAVCALLEGELDPASLHASAAVAHASNLSQRAGGFSNEALAAFMVQAQVLRRRGDRAGSESALQRVQAILDSLDPEEAARPSAIRVRLHSARMLGRQLLSTGRIQQAQTVLGAAVEVAKPWLPIVDDLPVVARVSLGKLSLLYGSALLSGKLSGDAMAAAEHHFEMGRELLQAVVDSMPHLTGVRCDLGGLLSNLASVYNQRRQWPEALQYAKAAIHHQQTVLRTVPESTSAKLFMGIHLAQEGMALVGLARFPEALDAFEEASLWSQHAPSMQLVVRQCATIVQRRGAEHAELADRAAAAAGRALRALSQRNPKAGRALWHDPAVRSLHSTDLAGWAAQEGW